MTLSIMSSGPGGAEPAGGPAILLVSPDLLSTSRIAGLARQSGGRLDTLRNLDDPLPGGPYDLVLLDLQTVSGDPAVLVTRVRAIVSGSAAKSPPLVAFGPHVAKERLEQALAAGTDAAVSRGELLGSFPALITRWCG
ncbi:MAG: hypothetical protein ACKO6B_13875 [Planctomycetia bacterium]